MTEQRFQTVHVTMRSDGKYDVDVWGRELGEEPTRHAGVDPPEVARLLKQPPTYKRVEFIPGERKDGTRPSYAVPTELLQAMQAEDVALGNPAAECPACAGTGQVDGAPCSQCQAGW